MSVDRAARGPRGEPLTVVVDPGAPPYEAPPALELRGTLEDGRLEGALRRLAGPSWRYRLHRHGPSHHTLTMTGPLSPDDFPAGLLADLLTKPGPGGADPARPAFEDEAARADGGGPGTRLPGRQPRRTAPDDLRETRPTPLQRELLAETDASPRAARHVEQLTWDWHGPLDRSRFRAAWQSVFDRESVLRAAFGPGPEPRLLIHDRVDADVAHLPHGTQDWDALVAQDRRRGIDPRRPGALRVTVLGAEPGPGPLDARHRVLLTYHHALLDGLSARLLVREFCHAYVHGGRLPGGERRPDIADHSAWLTTQNPTPATQFWTHAAPPPDAIDLPFTETAPQKLKAPRPGEAPPSDDSPEPAEHPRQRSQLSLSAAEAARLSSWAANWGATESTVLHLVWAVLLYRAAGADRAASVRFGVALPGRGIPLDGVARMPGPLRTALPLSVPVDPAATVPRLLVQLRDHVMEMASYEWISAGQALAAAGAGTGPRSLLVFRDDQRLPGVPDDELLVHGVTFGPLRTLDADTGFPLALVAHRDGDGVLELAVSYDADPLPGVPALLADCARLLRELPAVVGEFTTVAALVDRLGEAPPPATAPRVLRPAEHPGAGLVCLLPVPGLPYDRYEQLARTYPGPEALALLGEVPRAARRRLDALAGLLEPGGRLVLGGFSGSGAAAYEMARLVARSGGSPPPVVLAEAAAPVAGLARALAAAARAG